MQEPRRWLLLIRSKRKRGEMTPRIEEVKVLDCEDGGSDGNQIHQPLVDLAQEELLEVSEPDGDMPESHGLSVGYGNTVYRHTPQGWRRDEHG